MPPAMPQRVIEIVKRGAAEFFLSHGITDFKNTVESTSAAEYQWTGIIGLSGDLITGSLAITCQEALLSHTHPNTAIGTPVDAADRVDWLGEISNQLLGRIKNLTLEYSVNFSLSAPSVVKGQTLEVLGQGKKMIEKFYFIADGHPISITFVCGINPNFNFDTAVKIGKPSHAAEGESLLF